MTQHLLVFVKNVEQGKVKTRLAATVGNERALEIYRGLLAYTIAQTKGLEVEKHVFYSRAIEKNDAWKQAGFIQRTQAGEGLGERMASAFSEVLEPKTAEKGMPKNAAVIIGSDCPELTTDIIEEAFVALKSHDIVIGPAEDGGYYLLGMSSSQPELFQNKEWSTNTVAAATKADCERLGLQFYTLPILSDIDHEEDWEKHKDRVLPYM